MKTVTRKSLDELARIMPVISEENQKMYVGGTSGYTGGNPPTGYVDGYFNSDDGTTGNYLGDYVSIAQTFFQYENGKWDYTSGVEQVNRMHDYMRKYNHGVLDKALEEYRNDFKH